MYFEIGSNIVERLDKALEGNFSDYLGYFKGRLIESSRADDINGSRDKRLIYNSDTAPEDQREIGLCGESTLCHLDPPYSCYLCPKFLPYKEADHEFVFNELIENRQSRLIETNGKRLGVQLDTVIIAVSEVVRQCRGEVIVNG